MLFAQDIGIDLGTANTIVYLKGKGIVLREPSVVAVNEKTDPPSVVAVGNEAKDMIGRTPGSITAVKPLKDGVIVNSEITSDMLKEFIKKVIKRSPFSRARVLICVPSGITEVERKAVHDAARDAGAKYASLIHKPLAAAIGVGLPVTEAVGSMIVDIGGGTTEVAVVSYRDIVTAKSSRIAGDDFDEAIIEYIRKKHNVLIGERTAEEIKIKIGSAMSYDGEGAMDVRGRNLVDGLPKNVEITSEDVREALAEPVSQILETIRSTLEKTPPELLADIVDNGIMLTGGGALLREMDKLISKETYLSIVESIYYDYFIVWYKDMFTEREKTKYKQKVDCFFKSISDDLIKESELEIKFVDCPVLKESQDSYKTINIPNRKQSNILKWLFIILVLIVLPPIIALIYTSILNFLHIETNTVSSLLGESLSGLLTFISAYVIYKKAL